MVYAVRENVRSSNRFSLDQANGTLRINFVSIDPETNPGSRGNWAVVSMVITMSNFSAYKKGNPQTWLPIYISSGVYTVGLNRVDEQAKIIVAAVDRALDEYMAAARNN